MYSKPKCLLDHETSRVFDLRSGKKDNPAPLRRSFKRFAENWLTFETPKSPLWTVPQIVDALNNHQLPQLVVLSSEACIAAQQLCYIALERGFRTYLVIEADTLDAISLMRLSLAGVIVLTTDQFCAEIGLCIS